ncbi:hypothetical protein [Kitasatospora sp. NPDC097691]|uniref:hypothetical protein n=1 Tax=Kitasatospora sp. NPDC097691 TaxID=3157231 RepID=UPI00332E3783
MTATVQFSPRTDGVPQLGAARLVPEPAFTTGPFSAVADSPEIARLGVDGSKVMRRAWYAYDRQSSWSWRRREDGGWAVSSVVRNAFDHWRPGRPEAEAAFKRLITGWISETRGFAALRSEALRQLVAVKPAYMG